jgi:hypothetical protein
MNILGLFRVILVGGLCFMLIGLRPLFWLTALGAFCAHLTIAIVSGSSQAIWQSKIEPETQGRVSAAGYALPRVRLIENELPGAM